MKFPTFNSDNTLIIRTDYSDEKAWKQLCLAIERSSERFVKYGEGIENYRDYIDYFEAPELSNLSVKQVLSLLPELVDRGEIFIVDRESLSHRDRPILVVDVFDRDRTFRVVPSQMWSVDANLGISNMDFEEFADNVDEYGIFRGFEE